MEKPLIELVNEQEFTNREKELEKFWNLAMRAKRNNGSSFALIAAKRRWENGSPDALVQ